MKQGSTNLDTRTTCFIFGPCLCSRISECTFRGFNKWFSRETSPRKTLSSLHFFLFTGMPEISGRRIVFYENVWNLIRCQSFDDYSSVSFVAFGSLNEKRRKCTNKMHETKMKKEGKFAWHKNWTISFEFRMRYARRGEGEGKQRVKSNTAGLLTDDKTAL